MKADCAVLITAAGLSGRMGKPKALMQWNKEKNFLQKVIATYNDFACKEIIVTLNHELISCFDILSDTSVRFILNPHPELERMHSIQLGLRAINSCSYCFIQSVDNPFVESELLDKIYLSKSDEKYVTPSYHGKSGHPIMINSLIINRICQMDVVKHPLNEVLKQFPRKLIEVENKEILYNINTMEDYQRLIGC